MYFKVKTILKRYLERSLPPSLYSLCHFSMLLLAKKISKYIYFPPFSYTKVGILYGLFQILLFFSLNIFWRSLWFTENLFILITATSEFHLMNVLCASRPPPSPQTFELSGVFTITNEAAMNDLVSVLLQTLEG